jgi:hypothetical protein
VALLVVAVLVAAALDEVLDEVLLVAWAATWVPAAARSRDRLFETCMLTTWRR